ncbi:MAG: MraY family glycosyltransferase [Actinomycetota bacterium]|nr:MraY family glycosyltransferase [Actinomycetota bacterium]
MPYLGGAAIVISFAAVVLIAVGIRPPASGLAELVAFLGLGAALAVLGLTDDIYRGLSPVLRVLVEAGAGSVIWVLGDSAHLAGAPGWLNALITVLWIVGVTNAFNLLDNMDGLSAGIAALTALTIFAIACFQQRYLVASLSIALAGCAIGFLWHNFHPAKIYMGDAGSLFLGFVLSVLLLKLRAQQATRVDIAVILAIPAVALFDTALVVASRLVHRRNPFLGGKDHTSHRLIRAGRSVHGAVALIYAAGALCDGAAIVMAHLGRAARIAGIVGIVGAAACAAIYLGRIPVYNDAPAASESPPSTSLDAQIDEYEPR